MINGYINASGKSLTKLWSNGHYTWTDIIKDDITELIRLYISYPNSLKEHLKFLSTTWDIEILNRYNLYRLSKEDADTIYNLISKAVDNYLQ